MSAKPTCRGCGADLLPPESGMADCCPCNSWRGVNHGLIPPEACTCDACDPAQTGASRACRMSAEKTAEESAWEIGIECDIRSDRGWNGQWHCALHGAWFRSDDEPLLCPFGMGYVKGHAAGQVEENESSKDAIAAARAEGEQVGHARGVAEERERVRSAQWVAIEDVDTIGRDTIIHGDTDAGNELRRLADVLRDVIAPGEKP